MGDRRDTQEPSGAKAPPLTARGWATREKILDAARRVFERHGYLDVKIVDITREAGVAAGSFYTYFDSKEDTFGVLLETLRDEITSHDESVPALPDDPIEAIRRATRVYFDSYQKNVGLWRIFEQMAAMDGHFRQLRLERARFFASRNARMIKHLQASGHADPALSADAMSLVLSSMVSRTAQLMFNFGLEIDDVEELVESVVQVWVRSLGLPDGVGRA